MRMAPGTARRARVSVALALLAALVFDPTAVAHGQPLDYQTAVKEGLKEFELGHWEEARTFFVKAHDLRPTARTLRSLGMVAFELRHYVESARLLRASLADKRDALTPEQRADVQQLVERTDMFVGRLHVSLEPATALLTIDGATPRREPTGEISLDPGEHSVVASAPGYQSVRRTVDVGGEKTPVLTVRLQPVAEATAATTSLDAALAPSAREHRDDGDGILSQWWFWTAAGGVVVGAIIAGVLVGNSHDNVRPVEAGDLGGVVVALEAQ